MDKNNTGIEDEEVIEAILVEETEIEVIIDLVEEEVPDNVVSIFSPTKSHQAQDQDQDQELSFLEKQKERFKQKDYNHKQTLFAVVIVALVLLTIVGFSLESPLFNVDKVELVNSSNTELTQDETESINAVLADYVGSPMYRVNTDELSKSILDFPEIKDVNIDKNWPGTIVVSINRRSPVAYINTDKGVVLLDENGLLFEKAQEQPQGLPTFEGIQEVTLFKEIDSTEFLEILKAVPDEIYNQVVQIKSLEGGAYELFLNDGINIRLGQPDDLERKLAIAWSIILAKDRSEIAYIDVSVPTLPVSGSPELQV